MNAYEQENAYAYDYAYANMPQLSSSACND
jgi:hypothetical protein